MSHKHPVPIRENLLEYYDNVKSISKTARYFKTSNPTVRKWLKNYTIPIYSHKDAVNQDFNMKKVEVPTKEELIFLYNNVSIADIRSMYNIGQETFYEWLEIHNIDKLTISCK